MKHGCVNLDWLEVFCLEDPHFPLEPMACIELGFVVKEREYGTPQYKQMFTCFLGDTPILEVRRLPYSLRSEGGIFEDGSCHIRYVNRSCYAKNPLQHMTEFIRRARLTFKSISRCDICVDFIRFDNGDSPNEFIFKYLSDKVIKMHQAKLRGVSRDVDYVENFSFGGRDCINSKRINSLKWGGKGCPVSTKLYNKVQEMKDTKYKSYIVDQWISAGLVTRQTVVNADGSRRTALMHDGVETDVWRLEFSVKLQGAKLVENENGGVLEFTLSTIDNRDKLLNLFYGLSQQYWDFRKPEMTATGKVQRSNRLKRIAYIKCKLLAAYVPKHLSSALDLTRFERSVIRKLEKWANSVGSTNEECFYIMKVIHFLSKKFRCELIGVGVDDMPRINDPSLQTMADYKQALKDIKKRVSAFNSDLIVNLLDFYEKATLMLCGELTKRNDSVALAYNNLPF